MSKINETNYPRRTQANYADTDMLVIQAAGGNTYTTRIEDLREDCQETLAPALNTMRENLATVEGSTASKAYAKGDFLVFGGRLCKAKTSIAVNATLILDTNIELASVGGELSSLSSDLVPQFEAMYNNTIMMVRMGKIRMMYAIGNYVTVPLSSAIPSGDRPQHQVQGVLTTQGSDKAYIIRLSIQGVIDILLNGSVVSSVNNAAFFLVWCVS